MKFANLKYSVDHIAKCLTTDRLGGPCFFSICGAGETLAQQETLAIVHLLLKNGHLVNITTNGTLTNKIRELDNFSENELERLHFSFSYHFLELKRLNLIEAFFNSVNYVRDKGASFIIQLNLCDEYIPYIEEIKGTCFEHVGAYPQIAATRKESHGLKDVELMTSLSREEYEEIGNSFESQLFNFTMENFNKKRREFCYAGERSATLNLATGMMSKCYADTKPINIFEYPEEKINFEAVGKYCGSSFCFNSSHFMSLGVIDNDDARTYCSIRDRVGAGWFNDTMKYALSQKLSDTNPVYSNKHIKKLNRKRFLEKVYYTSRHMIGKTVHKVVKNEKL